MNIKEQIEEACAEFKRDPSDIKIVVASKYADSSSLNEVFESGLDTFGENRVQDLISKQEQLSGLSIKWHLIGHLQANKVNKVVGSVKLIHSVDSLKLAKKISDRAIQLRTKQKILMQVNVGDEASKSGFKVSQSLQNSQEIGKLEGVKLCGLMSMAPFTDQVDVLENHFEESRELFSEVRGKLGPEFKWLSMGMSSDFELAIKHGANILRLGSIVFK